MGKKHAVIIITGASSGIGMEFARQLDAGLYTIDEFWLIARREDRLRELAASLNHAARVIPLDLETQDGRDTFGAMLHAEKPVIRMMINSSGYGLMGDASDQNRQEQLGMIELNCKALTDLTCLSLPYMEEKSRLIQLASSAAFLPQPGFAVYAATKAYVLSFTRALREELRSRQILVTAVCPGPVRTEFFDRAERNGSTLFIKKLAMADVSQVVRDALRASAAGRGMSVSTPLIKGFYILSKAVPHDIMLAGMHLLKSHHKENDRI